MLRNFRSVHRLYRQRCATRWMSTENEVANDNLQMHRLHFLKKLTSTFLFGATLGGVMLARRKKRKDMEERFQDCVLLPKDENYESSLKVYKYHDFVLPDFVIQEKTEIQNFEVRSDDIFVVSFPKSGTTWIQEIVYLVATNLDFESAKKSSLDTRFPYLEFIYPGIKDIAKMKSVRFLKTHLPYSLLPPDVHVKKPKVIYIMRNPKDVVVSYYHYVEMLTPTNYKGTFKEFFDSFLQDKVMYGPVWKHNLEYWEHQNEDHILIIKYEDLHKDVRKEIRRISDFLDKPISEEDIDKIADHCSFQEMSKNPSVNYEHLQELGISHRDSKPFLRQGKVGDWLNYFTEKMNTEFEEWQTANYKKTGPEFMYQLDCT